MTFHEFAHAYHWRIGFDDPEIKAAYDAAMAAGLYQAVDYNMAADGKPVKAYAAGNEREYFAELSEAYFGLNDYFPFTRRQLKEYDPAGYAVVDKMWGLSEEELNHRGQ
jgi:5'-deoxynucleotidase YfbR-like HD superfamily hydrolase